MPILTEASSTSASQKPAEEESLHSMSESHGSKPNPVLHPLKCLFRANTTAQTVNPLHKPRSSTAGRQEKLRDRTPSQPLNSKISSRSAADVDPSVTLKTRRTASRSTAKFVNSRTTPLCNHGGLRRLNFVIKTGVFAVFAIQ
jgi:hypothetical protein